MSEMTSVSSQYVSGWRGKLFYLLTYLLTLKVKYNQGTTEYRGIFHGTYRGAKSVVPHITNYYNLIHGCTTGCNNKNQTCWVHATANSQHTTGVNAFTTWLYQPAAKCKRSLTLH